MTLFRLFAIATVVMGLSHTLAKEKIFEVIRAAVGKRSPWLGTLVSCPYCISYWIALAIVPPTDGYFVAVVPFWPPAAWLLRWALSSIFVANVAAYLRVFFYLFDESQGLVRRAERLRDLELREHTRPREGPP
jgi:hypothetical protein